MKIYLNNEYELANSRKIILKIRKTFPEIKIEFIHNKNIEKKIKMQRFLEKTLDDIYLENQKNEDLYKITNYYAGIKQMIDY